MAFIAPLFQGISSFFTAGTAATASVPAILPGATFAMTPVSTGLFGTGITMGQLGTGLSVMGSIGQGMAAARAAEYNAALALEQGKAKEAALRRQGKDVLGKMRAGIAKSGVTTEGTPLLVLAESAELSELDALTARWNAETSADLYRQQAKSSYMSIPFNVGTSLLTSSRY